MFNTIGWLLMAISVAFLLVAIKAILFLRSSKTRVQKKPPEAISVPKVEIQSMTNGSVSIKASGKSAVIKLSRGSHLRAQINGKEINLKASPNKDWEEFVIDG